MIIEKAPVKTYYKNKKVYGDTRPYYQIYLGVKTAFIDQEVFIISEQDYNKLCDEYKELKKLQTEYNIINNRFEKLSNDYTELTKTNAELKRELDEYEANIKEFNELKETKEALEKNNKELTAEVIKTNKINKVLYNGLLNIVTQNPIKRLFNRVPQDVQNIIKDNKIKGLLTDKE